MKAEEVTGEEEVVEEMVAEVEVIVVVEEMGVVAATTLVEQRNRGTEGILGQEGDGWIFLAAGCLTMVTVRGCPS